MTAAADAPSEVARATRSPNSSNIPLIGWRTLSNGFLRIERFRSTNKSREKKDRSVDVIRKSRWRGACKQAWRPPLCIPIRRARDICASDCLPLACVRCAVMVCRCLRGISRRREGCLCSLGNPRYHPLAESQSQAQRGPTLCQHRTCVPAHCCAFWLTLGCMQPTARAQQNARPLRRFAGAGGRAGAPRGLRCSALEWEAGGCATND